MNLQNYIQNIFSIKTKSDFNKLALEVFQYQYNNNKIYKRYINLIKTNTQNISHYSKIPFLPIELFRTHDILCGNGNPKTVFLSSGTTNVKKSQHHIIDLEIYKKSIINSFNLFFGDVEDYVFFCLIPEFKSQKNSSLSFMSAELIKKSKNTKSGFYLNRLDELRAEIKLCQKENQKFILFGLSFEILEFAKTNKMSLQGGYIIQTGGTKRGLKEIIQEDLHNQLEYYFDTKHIYSEYGMAELLSQSYYLKRNCFESPPWKKILIRDKTTPLSILQKKKRGCINIIDLANIHSCSFIATNDIGLLTNTGFNILGRAQNAAERGCNLMI